MAKRNRTAREHETKVAHNLLDLIRNHLHDFNTKMDAKDNGKLHGASSGHADLIHLNKQLAQAAAYLVNDADNPKRYYDAAAEWATLDHNA